MSGIVVTSDLRPRFGSMRDQGPRPTCLAFALSDTHASLRNGWQSLSSEYLYYHAIQRDGKNAMSCSTISASLAALKEDGQPLEASWPYLNATPIDLAKWHPPKGTYELFRRSGACVGPTFGHAWDLLTSGRPCVLAMSISDSFYAPANGVITGNESPDATRRHAVVAVACGEQHAHSRLILVRNSWGASWGMNGHAWIPEAYLAPRLLYTVVLSEAA